MSNASNPHPWLRRTAMQMSLQRLPILHSLVSKSNCLRTKMKKPMMIHKLVFLKKSIKLKRFKLLKYYNYGYLGGYQFDSPSTTPLVHYCNQQHEVQNRNIHDFYSVLFWCKCFGSLKAQAREEDVAAPMESPLAGEIDFEDDDDSVDERAERFIENFYAEMRLQRQESF
ncbi:hypothetical protein F3Y22_tig00111330pilonHSYRG00976 [Hibiscus syriacus]|uniref:Cotton fiber protein n=1 Tax=Hibiscus syriacus TaxID=106335 RepID=A0A6A2YQC9_HIBSY|nr:uncharacterized protein LOC120158790 [Hibiscus syriacus]KAE8681465.1 hypothetical protein F3Y22_tig00111330pilonHSYRG00976 [Hibiscus syriacus]